MAALTYAQIKTEIQNQLSDKGTVNSTSLDRYMDMAQRRIADEHDWPNLIVRDFVQLTEAIVAGTAGVTNASQSVPVSGGPDFTSPDVSGRKFALSYQDPWYEISSATSDTLTLADAYAEATASSQTYVIYEDRVSMPAACRGIVELWIQDGARRLPLDDVTGKFLPSWSGYPGSANRPFQYQVIEDKSSAMQIQVGPYAPDEDYRLELVYKQDVTDGSMSLDKRLEMALIYMTLSFAWVRDDLSKSRDMRAEAVREIERVWSGIRRNVESFQVGQMTAPDDSDPAPFRINVSSLEG